ncbi:hypothetical protein EDC01DRAFT_510763 [Geopyxis carbonaria]|nr:hypothetical protein EDC01DRAFT_510763 [Geopyxis carbonaria]
MSVMMTLEGVDWRYCTFRNDAGRFTRYTIFKNDDGRLTCLCCDFDTADPHNLGMHLQTTHTIDDIWLRVDHQRLQAVAQHPAQLPAAQDPASANQPSPSVAGSAAPRDSASIGPIPAASAALSPVLGRSPSAYRSRSPGGAAAPPVSARRSASPPVSARRSVSPPEPPTPQHSASGRDAAGPEQCTSVGPILSATDAALAQTLEQYLSARRSASPSFLAPDC